MVLNNLPPLPNVEFSRSEKEWQPIQWDSLVVMPTLLNEMLLPIATDAVKKHDFVSVSLVSQTGLID
jgi:hypothetical protein